MLKYLMKTRLAFSILICIVIVCSIETSANAQLSGFHSAYYQNQYLVNPSFAGLEEGLTLNTGIQQQWSSMPGSPTMQNLSADYNAGNNVGLGLLVNADQAGLISRTRVMGTYAYHLPVNQDETSRINFGISLGISDSYLDYTRIVGDQGDIAAQNFNQRTIYTDGDLGLSYTSERINVQVALPNLRSVFFANNAENLEVDRATFYTALSYRTTVDNGYSNYSIEPKLAYRGVKGFSNILDIGVNFIMSDYELSLSGIYHSNESVTLAAGFSPGKFGLLFAYNINSGPLSGYAQNTFEVGLKFRLIKEKKWF